MARRIISVIVLLFCLVGAGFSHARHRQKLRKTIPPAKRFARMRPKTGRSAAFLHHMETARACARAVPVRPAARAY
jgi:hypothetical protein